MVHINLRKHLTLRFKFTLSVILHVIQMFSIVYLFTNSDYSSTWHDHDYDYAESWHSHDSSELLDLLDYADKRHDHDYAESWHYHDYAESWHEHSHTHSAEDIKYDGYIYGRSGTIEEVINRMKSEINEHTHDFTYAKKWHGH